MDALSRRIGNDAVAVLLAFCENRDLVRLTITSKPTYAHESAPPQAVRAPYVRRASASDENGSHGTLTK